ncbi:unnamed protein product [Thelazia callipaeda]|uniref:Coiled-coil domain-containing protein 86 n=1 Tax=Thelazia callipaeda TaxID=103827 RepID=A0A0N5CUF5_THECL|nr:unnamed protein product [Thelazia callipaeda]
MTSSVIAEQWDSNAMDIDNSCPGTVPTITDNNTDQLRTVKSGRKWKSVRKERSSAVIKVKPLKSSWERKMQAKQKLMDVKKLQQEVRDILAAKKAVNLILAIVFIYLLKAHQLQEKLAARKEQERRREENARKAEVVQVIKNTLKLKRTKKKQLRRIEKRDTN